jgi:uncharacterized protein YjbI with pentapeptide repeats
VVRQTSILALALTALLLTGIAQSAPDSREVVKASEILEMIDRGEPIDYDNVIVEGYLDLSSCELKSVKLKNVVFQGPVNFGGAVFTEDASFKNTEFRDGATFTNAEFKIERADFKNTKFRGEAKFDNAEFEVADFYEAKFNGAVSFKNANFRQDVDFRGAQFDDDAEFQGAKFGGLVTFSDDRNVEAAQFNKTANFADVKFGDVAKFNLTQFGGYANFENARFNKTANFGTDKPDISTLFGSCVNFKNARFDENAMLKKAQFEKDVDFCNATFNKNADFMDVKFDGDADFGKAQFNEDVTFEEAQLEGYALFEDAHFGEKSHLCLNRTRYYKLRLRWDNVNTQNFEADDEAYLYLIRNYRDMGWFEDANECYYEYMKNRECKGRFSDCINKVLFVSYGYGTKPEYSLIWSFGLIILFGIIWDLSGIRASTLDVEKGDSEGNRRMRGIVKFIDAIIFSAVVFLSGTKLFVDPPE